jgi:hypothetical protein
MAHRAFGRDIIYTIILYTIIYRAPGVANGNIHFLLHAAVHPGLHCTELAGWTLIACYVTYVTQWPRCWTLIGCHHAKFASKLKYFTSSEFVDGESVTRQIKTWRRFSLAKNSPDTRLYVHLYGILSPRRVWCTVNAKKREIWLADTAEWCASGGIQKWVYAMMTAK